MIVDQQFLTGVRTTFQAVFDQVMGEAPNQWQKFVTVVDTQGKTLLTFSWLGAPPMPRVLKGALEYGKAFDHDYTITVSENGVGIEIKEQSFMSDPLGTITLFVKNMMIQASKYEDKIAAEALSNGLNSTTNGAAFDGKAFYANDHTYGDSATHDNFSSVALASDGVEYSVGWQTINTAEDDSGEPMGLVPNTFIVPPGLRLTARQLLQANIIGNNSNVLAGDCELIVSPFLTTQVQFHLLACTPGIAVNPVIFAEQMPKRFVAQDGLDSEGAFNSNVYRYKIDNKISVGYGDPRQGYGSEG